MEVSSSSKSGNDNIAKSCLGPAIFMIACLFMMALLIMVPDHHEGYWPSIWLGTSALLAGGIVFSLIHRHMAIRHRIASLLVVYITFLLFFASVYKAVNVYSPSAFSVSDSISLGIRFSQFDDGLEVAQMQNERLFILSVLETYPAQCFQAAKKQTSDHVLPNGMTLRIKASPPYASAGGSTNGSGSITLTGDTEFRFDPGLSIKDLGRLQELILHCDSVSDFSIRLDELKSQTTQDRDNAIETLEAELKGASPLRMLDFIYFSTVTLTTLGYGDILPNSSFVRVLVSLQSICGVFLVGYSLSLFWPDSND